MGPIDKPEFVPSLHIIMRSDIFDMNPGKGMAQAAHAQAMFSADANRMRSTVIPASPSNQARVKMLGDFDAWSKQATDFGVTYSRTATEKEIVDLITSDPHQHNMWGSLVIDPTYPYRNWYGQPFVMSIVTCGYVFDHSGLSEEKRAKLYSFPLQS